MIKLPARDTKTFKILEFIGSKPNGVRSIEVEKFIITELSGKTWDPAKRAGGWRRSLYGYSKTAGIYKKYCVKAGDNWFLTLNTRNALIEADVAGPVYARASKSSIADVKNVRDLSVNNAESIAALPDRLSHEIIAAVNALDIAKANRARAREAAIKAANAEKAAEAAVLKSENEVLALLRIKR